MVICNLDLSTSKTYLLHKISLNKENLVKSQTGKRSLRFAINFILP